MPRFLPASICAGALALGALVPAHAAIEGTVIIQAGPTLEYRNLPPPPPPRVVIAPRVRHGHVWVEGHWEWVGTRYRWVDGYWIAARPGYQYRQPHWVQMGGDWRFERGGWHGRPGMRDRDRDGIRNRYDRDMDGDGLRNDRDWDRDGDGRPNRHDRHPDNPRRR